MHYYRIHLFAPLILSLAFSATDIQLSAQAVQYDWLMKGHDTRRSGQSPVYATFYPEFSETTWQRTLPGENVINVGASTFHDNAFVGTWGLQRNPLDSNDPRTWDKYDGALFGFDGRGDPLWGNGEVELDLVHRCYEFDGRERSSTDLLFCGAFNQYHASYYNGTVEGQPAIDPDRGVMYVGRGDGKLYAIDVESGEIVWRYVTFNPQLPSDPDGGGEVVTSPLYDSNGTVYFGTWGEGPYETNAIYAVNPDGTLRWRYPTNSSTSHRYFASPAMNPAGSTVYFSTFTDRDSLTRPGWLYAFNQLGDGDLIGEDRLKWRTRLELEGKPIVTATMAVGEDGVIYVGGSVVRDDRNVPVVAAFRDQGDTAVPVWTPTYRELNDGAQFVLGIGLQEKWDSPVDSTFVVHTTTANFGSPLFNYKKEGTLYAIDPATGDTMTSYDPSDDVPGAFGGINSPALDAYGQVYIGVRGHYSGPFAPERAPGYYFGLQYYRFDSSYTMNWYYQTDDNYVEWSHPAIDASGGIYAGSCSNGPIDSVYQAVHSRDEIPEGTTPTFYRFGQPPMSVPARHNASHVEIESFPNPFTSVTALSSCDSRLSNDALLVSDQLGRTVARLDPLPFDGDCTRWKWDGRSQSGATMPSGTYVVSSDSPDARVTVKIVKH